MGKVAGLVAFAVVACVQPALAQGTEQEREACTPDAMRLCGQFIPDADRIETCSAQCRVAPSARLVTRCSIRRARRTSRVPLSSRPGVHLHLRPMMMRIDGTRRA